MLSFETELVRVPGEPTATMVILPPDVAARLGGRARIPIQGTINGTPFRGSTMPQGDGTHCVGFRREIRETAGVEAGEKVVLEIARDGAPRTVEVPPDLAAALDVNTKLRQAFDAMSYTHRKEYVQAVLEAKKPETRERRIAKTVEAMKERASKKG